MFLGQKPAKRIKIAPLRPENDIAFQLGPYMLDENSAYNLSDLHDSKNPASWTSALKQKKTDIRAFDDRHISPEQLSVRTNLIETARNTLVTGEAGTGKTFTQLSLIKTLNHRRFIGRLGIDLYYV